MYGNVSRLAGDTAIGLPRGGAPIGAGGVITPLFEAKGDGGQS